MRRNLLKSQRRTFTFIQPTELEKQLSKFTIIDVRDPTSFDKLHIKNAINISSDVFKKQKLDLKGDIVIHCQLSLIRGPECAEHLDTYYQNGQVYLLSGGFKNWKRLYETDPNLCESK